MGMGLAPLRSAHQSGQKFSALERHRTWQGTCIVPETLAIVYGAWRTSTYSGMY